jgi:hypothetical protein
MAAFYSRNEERFVSDYAATKPIEYAAEVFPHFVLKDKPVAVSGITEQKLLFMHGFPNLINVIQTIRARMADKFTGSTSWCYCGDTTQSIQYSTCQLTYLHVTYIPSFSHHRHTHYRPW